MSFTEFYVIGGGSGANNNAGTTTGAHTVSVVNGSWSTVTNIYTGTSGTEFAGTSAGEYASVFADGATVAVMIAKIDSVGALGVSITLSTTERWGTAPTTGAGTRSCKVGGSHTSELPWASGGLGSVAPTTVSTRVNWKQATYTIVASRTFSNAGTTTTPIWFRGYNTTPGDCDSDPTLARPLLSVNSTFVLTMNGAHQYWTSINFTGSRSGTIVALSGAGSKFIRCQVENTSSNVLAIAATFSSATNIIAYSWFKTPATATTTGVISNSSNSSYYGCIAEGGGLACFNIATGTGIFVQCITLGGVNGFLSTTGQARILFCTVYNSSGDGIKWTGTPSANTAVVLGCLLSNCTGYGINNASGTNTNDIFRACNDFYACSGGDENGFGDSPSFFNQSESASPFINTSTNFGIAAGKNALNNGFAPGGFEAFPSTVSYNTIGAVQSAGSSYVPQVFE